MGQIMRFRVVGVARWQRKDGHVLAVGIDYEITGLTVQDAEAYVKEQMKHNPPLPAPIRCLGGEIIPTLLSVKVELNIVRMIPLSQISFDAKADKFEGKTINSENEEYSGFLRDVVRKEELDKKGELKGSDAPYNLNPR